jgi:CubicO group peptidase (beta-lactamase class C family)
MNHSAGFEEPVQQRDASDETLVRSARETLRERRPTRVRESGKLSVYSNYGAMLAGAIVAEVSGLDFESYVEQRIFTPLGMRHSTFREPYGRGAPLGLPLPMPAELAADRATALSWQTGKWQPQPYQYLLPEAPAGSAASTASDMARYMIALLEPAVLEGAGVLSAKSCAVLRQESFKPAAGLRGIHHGFFDAPLGRHSKIGYANLSHGGNAAHFESYLSLLPELGLGVFVTTNSSSGVDLSRDVPEQLLRHYFPLQDAAPHAKTSAHALSEYAGDYRDLRRWYTKLPALFRIDDVQTIALGANDCLLITLPRAERACFVRIGSDLFEQADGDARIAFVRNPRGDITHVLGALNAEQVGLRDSALWLRMWLAAGLMVVLGVLVGAFRRWQSQQLVAQTVGQRLAGFCMVLVAISWLAFYSAGAAWQLSYGGDAFHDYPQPLLVFGLRSLVVAVCLSTLAVLMLPFVFRGAGWSLARRLRHTFVLLVLLGLCLALQRWNVIGFNYA